MMKRALLVACMIILGGQAASAACTTGQTTCTTDSSNDAIIAGAITNQVVQARVFTLWLAQCLNIWPEAASTAGHLLRSAYCDQVASGGVSQELLTAIIMTPLVQSELLGGGACNNFVGGCMVDVDINTAIDTALTVNISTASTTATASSGSNSLTVASATGIVAGQTTYAVGVPNGSLVVNVSGTTVLIDHATTAALSATPIFFSVAAGLP